MERILSIVGISIILIGTLVLASFLGFESTVEQVFDDVLFDEVHRELAQFAFTLTSKGAFTTNYPIHVRVRVLIIEKQVMEMLPIQVVFPNACEYPRRVVTPLEIPAVARVSISNISPYCGEAYMEFTYSGTFGYMIFLKDNPLCETVRQKIITVSPYEVRLQIDNVRRQLGIGIVALGIAITKTKIIVHYHSHKVVYITRQEEFCTRL